MIHMSTVNLNDCHDIELFAGRESIQIAPMRIFSDEACGFLDDLSRELLSDKLFRRYPDVLSFAYWCRKSNIAKERESRSSQLDQRMGRGLALHITPSNVPINFMFSYAFSLLAGNASIVRIPSRSFEQVDAVLGVLRHMLEQHDAVRDRTAFVIYPSAGETTAILSSYANVRVIWGGDTTVGLIRGIQRNPRCVDIAFPDRYSIAVLDADAVLALSGEGAVDLARRFYNDTYLMDQNACSSPHAIFWLGSESSCQKAKSVFWDCVAGYASDRYVVQPSVMMDKYAKLCGDFIRGKIVDSCTKDGVLTVGEIPESESLSTDCRGVGGYFYEKRITGFNEIAKDTNAKYQTITYYGIDPVDLRKQVLDSGLTGIDRIVPIGSAMDIGLVWDGYDLISEMSRIVDIK